MTVERVLTVQDAAEWRDLIPASVSVFSSVEYAGIMQEHTGNVAQLYVLEEGDSLVVYPFFLRSVNALPFAVDFQVQLWDTVTPEYTGPLDRGPLRTRVKPSFSEKFASYCARTGIVAEFIHLHSFDWRSEFLEPSCMSVDREIVYVDLESSEEQLWGGSFSHACRRNIRRAQRRGVEVFRATKPDHIREFHHVYTGTMDYNRALGKYYFPLDYFMAFFERMPENALFFLAECQGQVVAGGLYLHDAVDVYAHLAGIDRTFQHVCPANAEVYEAIRWARLQGKRRLILGGGYTPAGAVSQFKAGFSPLRSRFCIYRRVHRAGVYDTLCRASSEYHHCDLTASDYFPAYRSLAVTGGSTPSASLDRTGAKIIDESFRKYRKEK